MAPHVMFGLLFLFGAIYCVSSALSHLLKKPAGSLTFFVASDTHLTYCVVNMDVVANSLGVSLMNHLPGKPYPTALGGGAVGVPRAVIVSGDLVNDGWTASGIVGERQWPNYTALYGVNGEGNLRYPTIEAFGNHDGNGFIRKALVERNRQRLDSGAVRRLSANGLHASWDWPVGSHWVHFVNVNLYPGRVDQEDSWKQPAGSLDFMVQDLRETVGTSGRPVVIISHYGPNCPDWWPAEEQEAFVAEIASYNVIAFIHGHTHRAEFYRWRGIDIYNAPAIQPNPDDIVAGFLVFELDAIKGVLRAALHTNTTWGSVQTVKVLSFGNRGS